MTSGQLAEMKLVLRENEIPFFTDEQLEYYLSQADGDMRKALYKCLLIKAEDTTLQVSGLSCADSSKYFRRLASMYIPTNSGVLRS